MCPPFESKSGFIEARPVISRRAGQRPVGKREESSVTFENYSVLEEEIARLSRFCFRALAEFQQFGIVTDGGLSSSASWRWLSAAAIEMSRTPSRPRLQDDSSRPRRKPCGLSRAGDRSREGVREKTSAAPAVRAARRSGSGLKKPAKVDQSSDQQDEANIKRDGMGHTVFRPVSQRWYATFSSWASDFEVELQ